MRNLFIFGCCHTKNHLTGLPTYNNQIQIDLFIDSIIIIIYFISDLSNASHGFIIIIRLNNLAVIFMIIVRIFSLTLL